MKLLKIEGLYKWRSYNATKKWLFMLTIALFVLIFIPFRYIFPLIVLDFFTAKFQNGSGFDRLLDAVGVPEKLPELD